jgi:hypothetical protein
MQRPFGLPEKSFSDLFSFSYAFGIIQIEVDRPGGPRDEIRIANTL